MFCWFCQVFTTFPFENWVKLSVLNVMSSESGRYVFPILLPHDTLILKKLFIDIACWIKEFALKSKQTLYFVDNPCYKNSIVTS